MRLTIFTPTYNRAKRLNKVYQSIVNGLKFVENDDVEWIIVDDGSKDNTGEAVKSFSELKNLQIRYIAKENGGKHTAFNVGIENSKGDLFVCIDDDDYLTDNALADIFKLGKEYNAQKISGFVGRVVDPQGKLLGKDIFKDTIVSNTIEIRDKYRFWGEPEIYFTRVLKNYKFDVFGQEKFLTEAYLFDDITQKLPLVYTNIPMMVKEFFKGGLTDNALKIRIESPMGACAYYEKRFKLSKGFKNKLKAAINYFRFSYWRNSGSYKLKGAYAFFAKPIAYLLYKKDVKEYNNSK